MSYAIIGDPHYAAIEKQREFWKKASSLDMEGFVILGDIFTSKKKIDARYLWEFGDILENLAKGGRFVYIVTGNHDRYYSDPGEKSTPKRLFEGRIKNLRVFDEPETVEISGERVLMLPYPFGAKEAKEFPGVDVIYAHGELRPYYPDSGDSSEDFGEAEYLSGHYHKHVKDVYLGTPYSIDYSDLDKKKFYAVRDGGKFSYVRNEEDSPFVSVIVRGAGSSFCPYTGERFPLGSLDMAKLTGNPSIVPAGVDVVVPENLFGEEQLKEIYSFLERESIPFRVSVEKRINAESPFLEEGEIDGELTENPVDAIRDILPPKVRDTFDSIVKEAL